MKNLTFYLIVIILFSSCSANWHIRKAKTKCPECFKQDTVINETQIIKLDTTIYLDTNINVILPRDTVKIEKQIPKFINYSFNKIIKTQGIITTEAELKNGNLEIISYLDSSFVYRLQDSIRLEKAKTIKLSKIVIEKDVIIEKQTSWIKWLKIGIIGLVIIIVLGIGFKILKLFK